MLAGLLGTVRCADTRGRVFARGCSLRLQLCVSGPSWGCRQPSSPAPPRSLPLSDRLKPSAPSDTQSAFLPPATKGMAVPATAGTSVETLEDPCERSSRRGLKLLRVSVLVLANGAGRGRTAPPSWPTLPCDRSRLPVCGGTQWGLDIRPGCGSAGPSGVSRRQQSLVAPPPPHTLGVSTGPEHRRRSLPSPNERGQQASPSAAGDGDLHGCLPGCRHRPCTASGHIEGLLHPLCLRRPPGPLHGAGGRGLSGAWPGTGVVPGVCRCSVGRGTVGCGVRAGVGTCRPAHLPAHHT